MRKWSLGIVILLLASVVLAACGNNGNEAQTGTDSNKSSKTATIKIFNFKVEIAKEFDMLVKEYESEHPGIKIEVTNVVGDDYNTQLKAKFAGGQMPDIFNNEGYRQLDTWIDQVEDLSDQPWVKNVIDMAKEPMTKDGKMYGMPMNLEGLGFLYNKDLFQKAGINEAPTTLTQLEDAANKLQAAGTTPFINAYGSKYILGYHAFYAGMGKLPDTAAFIEGLNKGTASFVNNQAFADWLKFTDLTLQYGNKNPLTTDYNSGTSQFAAGQGAMTISGNWVQPMLDKVDPSLNVGIMPMPINNDQNLNDNIFAGVPNNWVIYKDSPVKEEAKAFLNWLVSSETGQKYITHSFKFIPAFKTFSADPASVGTIGAEIASYIEQGKIKGWQWSKYPDGATDQFAGSIQKYIAGKVDGTQLLAEFQKDWDKLSK